jgi:hypothetical protein
MGCTGMLVGGVAAFDSSNTICTNVIVPPGITTSSAFPGTPAAAKGIPASVSRISI